MVRRANDRRASAFIASLAALASLAGAATTGCRQLIDLRDGRAIPGDDAGPEGQCARYDSLRDVVRDHAAPDRGDGGVPPDPCPGGAVLCETFDDGTIHADRWEVSGAASQVAVEPLPIPRAGAGPRALHVHTTAGQTGSFTLHTVLATPRPRAYLRVFVLIRNGSNFDGNSLLSLSNEAPSYRSILLQVLDNSRFRLAQVPDSFTELRTGPFEHDQWGCVELTLEAGPESLDCATGTLQAWFDNVPFGPELSPAVTTPNYTILEMGLAAWKLSGPTLAVDMWFDDLVVSTTRVGCD
jgi:hypothetical protein